MKEVKENKSSTLYWMDDTANNVFASKSGKTYRSPVGYIVGEGFTTKGDPVYVVQIGLYLMGYFPYTIDGLFGPQTKSAIINYQKKSSWGLTPDGLCGTQTWKNLNYDINYK
ncbi:MAG: peptidoglycan-binding protein [Clostridium sp.]|nr:peptidoglycan-binding protein [Clostridium sp.]